MTYVLHPQADLHGLLCEILTGSDVAPSSVSCTWSVHVKLVLRTEQYRNPTQRRTKT